MTDDYFTSPKRFMDMVRGLPVWPKDVTIRKKDIKARAGCTICGSQWLEGEPRKCSCSDGNENVHYWIGTRDYITGDPTINEKSLLKYGVVIEC